MTKKIRVRRLPGGGSSYEQRDLGYGVKIVQWLSWHEEQWGALAEPEVSPPVSDSPER